MTVCELVRAPSGLRTCRGSKSGEPGGPTAAAVGQGHRRGGGREKRRGGRRSRGKDESRSGAEPQDLSGCCRPQGGRAAERRGVTRESASDCVKDPAEARTFIPGRKGRGPGVGGCGARGAGGGQEAREAATAQSGPEGPAARADLAPTCPGVTVGASGLWKRSARVDSYETLTA